MDLDEQLNAEIEDLVDEGLLDKESSAYGIARQRIHQGERSLTAAQRAVWDSEVGPALVKRREQIEWQRRMGKDD